MSNEQMTNEQKAEVIATRDGWVKNGICYTNPTTNEGLIQPIAELYLTDLNYLVPVAVRLAKLLPSCDIGFDLGEAIFDLTKTPSGTYQPLFDAVYDAIVYLENENK